MKKIHFCLLMALCAFLIADNVFAADPIISFFTNAVEYIKKLSIYAGGFGIGIGGLYWGMTGNERGLHWSFAAGVGGAIGYGAGVIMQMFQQWVQ